MYTRDTCWDSNIKHRPSPLAIRCVTRFNETAPQFKDYTSEEKQPHQYDGFLFHLGDIFYEFKVVTAKIAGTHRSWPI